jgi:ABC-type uncharacterized transport system substrate-binding protein
MASVRRAHGRVGIPRTFNRMHKIRYLLLTFEATVIFGMAHTAAAHPHVFIEGRAEIVFDAQKRIIAVRHVWKFDEGYSSFATLGLDTDSDGVLSKSELEPLAKVNVESLHEYAYFTFLKIGNEELTFTDPTSYTLTFDGNRLELDFTLPLARSVPLAGRATLEIYDPEYYIAFTFPDAAPLNLVNAPAGCTASFQAPGTLDTETMSQLAEIPAEQRDLPEDLQDAAAALTNLFVVECRE